MLEGHLSRTELIGFALMKVVSKVLRLYLVHAKSTSRFGFNLLLASNKEATEYFGIEKQTRSWESRLPVLYDFLALPKHRVVDLSSRQSLLFEDSVPLLGSSGVISGCCLIRAIGL